MGAQCGPRQERRRRVSYPPRAKPWVDGKKAAQALKERLTRREILAQPSILRDQLLLGLLHGCGLKIGEACRLCWEQVDIERKLLQVPCRNTNSIVRSTRYTD